MSKKEKSAALLDEFSYIMSCPICSEGMHIEGQKSLVCRNNHTFDIAKQGYVNMLTRAVETQYDTNLFENRQRFITESGFYSEMHETVSEMMDSKVKKDDAPLVVLDAGSGEGSHLDRIMGSVGHERKVGIGIDISKAGILLAAKSYPDPAWLVGDLAQLPMADGSCDIVLNILSPANYGEFRRVLAPGGRVIKVVPRSGYLKELREALYQDTEREEYQNRDTVSLFERNFESVDTFRITETKMLDREALAELVRLSPLAWNKSEAELESFARSARKVTVDLDILVGRM